MKHQETADQTEPVMSDPNAPPSVAYEFLAASGEWVPAERATEQDAGWLHHFAADGGHRVSKPREWRRVLPHISDAQWYSRLALLARGESWPSRGVDREIVQRCIRLALDRINRLEAEKAAVQL